MHLVSTLSQVPLRKLFLVAVTCKIVASYLAWLLQSPWILGFIIPLAFMAAYIALGFRRDRDVVSDERFGDSCYYLGFIFTISSIAFGLFDIPDLDKANRLTDVAVRFGAAMVSTLVGFIVRVYLVGFRQDVSSAMQSLEEQIVQSANALKTRMDLSQEAFRDYEAKVRQAASDAETRVRMAIENVGRHLSEEMASALRSLATEVQVLHIATANEMRVSGQSLATELSKSSQALATQLARAQELLVGFSDQLEARLKAVTFPDDYFTKELSPPLGKVVASVAALSEDLSSLKESVRSSVSGLSRAMEKLNVSMEAPQSVRELVDRQEALARQALGAISATSMTMESTAAVLKEHSETLNRLTQEFISTQSSQTEIISAARQLMQQLSQGSHAQSTEIEALGALLQRMEELVAEHRKALASLPPMQRTMPGPSAYPQSGAPPSRPDSVRGGQTTAIQPTASDRAANPPASHPEPARREASFLSRLSRLFGREPK